MWYRVVRAARYLGVSPWDLEVQPYTWLLAAEEAQAAEAAAQRTQSSRGGH